LACHGKESDLVTNNGKYLDVLPDSAARTILNASNSGYIGLIC